MNINCLNHNNGFEILKDFFKLQYPVSNLLLVLEILKGIKMYINKQYFSEFANDIIISIKQLPLKITEDEIKVAKKSDINQLLILLEDLLEGGDIKQMQVKEIIETLELELLIM